MFDPKPKLNGRSVSVDGKVRDLDGVIVGLEHERLPLLVLADEERAVSAFSADALAVLRTVDPVWQADKIAIPELADIRSTLATMGLAALASRVAAVECSIRDAMTGEKEGTIDAH